MQSFQAQGGADLGDFLDEAIDGPQGEVVGTFGPAAAQLVVEDDLAPVGERWRSTRPDSRTGSW